MLAATLLAGCGHGSSDGTSAAEAEKVISQKAGYAVTCKSVYLPPDEREVLRSEGGPRVDVWKCRTGQGEKHCWATAAGGDGLFASDSEVGDDLFAACPAAPQTTTPATGGAVTYEPKSASEIALVTAEAAELSPGAVEKSALRVAVRILGPLLIQMQEECDNTFGELARRTLSAVSTLRAASVEVQPHDVLLEVSAIAGAMGTGDINCRAFFAAYVNAQGG